MEEAKGLGNNVDLAQEIEQALALAQRAIPYTISLSADARRAYLKHPKMKRSEFASEALVFYDKYSKLMELSEVAQQAAEIAIRKLVSEGILVAGK